MTAVDRACNYWSNGGRCGQPETRRYLNGWRCVAHTPAALAGRPDIEPDPELTLAALQGQGRAARCVMTATSFDIDEAISFLDQVFGDVNSGRFSISHLTADGGMRSEHFQGLRSAAAKAQEWDVDRPQGIYFRVTMLPPQGVKGGRGGSDDAHALPFLWADLDYGTVGHKPPAGGLPLPPDEEAALKIIADLPTPTLIVHSGGGLYPIWKFKQPVYITDANRAEDKTRSQDWQNMIKANAEQLGWHYGSGVGDLARVLRLPGSVNRKVPGQERPCRVIEQTGEVLTW
jgi:putative DNA primase/helicase